MNPNKTGKLLRRIGLGLLGLLLLVNAGCLGAAIVAAGAAAAGGAAAGYAWFRGELSHDYRVDLHRAEGAVMAAMNKMQLPMLRRELGHDPERIVLETRITDGTITKISLTTHGSPIPADGPVTRIAVRVGAFGDEATSTRILNTIGEFLAPPGPQPVALPPEAHPPANVVPASQNAPILTPRPMESGPPPLAGPGR